MSENKFCEEFTINFLMIIKYLRKTNPVRNLGLGALVFRGKLTVSLTHRAEKLFLQMNKKLEAVKHILKLFQ